MNEKTLSRYLKVKALAEEGEAGEKDAARRIMERLEGQYPDLAEAAAAHVSRQAAKAREAARPAQAPARQRPSRARNWGELFRYAADVYETVQEVVGEAADARYGQTLAEEDVEFSGGSRQGNVFIRLKMSFGTVQEARDLNVIQRESFRQALHARLDEYLDALLQE
jgi:hypothetical protein